MTQKRIINLSLVGQLNSIVPPSETSEEEKATLAFDLGVEQVLREVAKREMIQCMEQAAAALEYREVNNAFNTLDGLCKSLASQVSGDHKESFENIDEHIVLLEDACMESGFTAGFIAGYKFLKGLH